MVVEHEADCEKSLTMLDQLQIRPFDPELMAVLKFRAAQESTTLREWTIRTLRLAVGLSPDNVPESLPRPVIRPVPRYRSSPVPAALRAQLEKQDLP